MKQGITAEKCIANVGHSCTNQLLYNETKAVLLVYLSFEIVPCLVYNSVRVSVLKLSVKQSC